MEFILIITIPIIYFKTRIRNMYSYGIFFFLISVVKVTRNDDYNDPLSENKQANNI